MVFPYYNEDGRDDGRLGIIDASTSNFSNRNLLEFGDDLVHITPPLLLISLVPLLVIIFISHKMDLGISIPIAISALRTCVQLSILGVILHPIFILGEHYWILVLLYVTFMITIASNVSFGRTKYYFRGMFWMIFTCVLTNITLVSAIAFGLIIKPDPIWDPQYVIPIVGMLLGNCINGTALCINGMLTSLVERQHEIELLMSFGATSFEASNRLLREAVHIGTMPLINNMTVIGLVSIPGKFRRACVLITCYDTTKPLSQCLSV
mmetsp:Transcript_43599/g.44111  ORF Transcript_43599/g.44111 Transcript_43599/m.44111 type:complete len:265 (+) Transcript_43599:120-914(+)